MRFMISSSRRSKRAAQLAGIAQLLDEPAPRQIDHIIERDDAIGEIAQRRAEEQPGAENREVDLHARVRAGRADQHVLIERAGREARTLDESCRISVIVDAKRRAKVEDDRRDLGGQLAAHERLMRAFGSADVLADVGTEHRMREGDRRLPAGPARTSAGRARSCTSTGLQSLPVLRPRAVAACGRVGGPTRQRPDWQTASAGGGTPA